MDQGGEKTLPGLRVSKCWKLLGWTARGSITSWLQRRLPEAPRMYCSHLSQIWTHVHFPSMLFSNTHALTIWRPRFLLPGEPGQVLADKKLKTLIKLWRQQITPAQETWLRFARWKATSSAAQQETPPSMARVTQADARCRGHPWLPKWKHS